MERGCPTSPSMTMQLVFSRVQVWAALSLEIPFERKRRWTSCLALRTRFRSSSAERKPTSYCASLQVSAPIATPKMSLMSFAYLAANFLRTILFGTDVTSLCCDIRRMLLEFFVSFKQVQRRYVTWHRQRANSMEDRLMSMERGQVIPGFCRIGLKLCMALTVCDPRVSAEIRPAQP